MDRARPITFSAEGKTLPSQLLECARDAALRLLEELAKDDPEIGIIEVAVLDLLHEMHSREFLLGWIDIEKKDVPSP